MKHRLSLFAVAAASLSVLGCSGSSNVVLCPSAAILADTATETVFRAGAPADPSGELFTANFVNASTKCSFDKVQGVATSSLDLAFRGTRVPSPDPASYTLSYFVAVNQAERVISKQIYTVRLDFAPGATNATAEDSIDQMEINLERGHLPDDYQFLSGFQLTDAQRAYNQKMGRYLP
jgi:hypothetical protein